MTNQTAMKLLDELRKSEFLSSDIREAVAKGYMVLTDKVAAEENDLPLGARIVQCDNCEYIFFDSQGKEIKDYFERVAPGETAPVCECPKCGSLAHYVLRRGLAKLEERYVVAFSWEHLDARDRPWILRWVFDRWNDEIVVVEEQMHANKWVTITDLPALRDISEHLGHNEDAINNPHDYGCIYAKTLPDWAQNAHLVKGYHV